MRIAMVGQRTNAGSVGGVEGHVSMLSAALSDLGHDVSIFVRPRYGVDPVGEHVRLLSRPSVPSKHLEAISHSTLAMLEARLRGFDVVHVHGVGPALTLPLGRLARRAGPVCVTIHDQDYNKDKWAAPARFALRMGEAAACRFADEVIVVARYLQRHLEAAHGRSSHYIPSGRESIETAPPGPLLERAGLEPHRYLLFVGRLVPEKGCHHLIEAILRSSTGHRLAVVGGPSHSAAYADRLRAMAAGDPRIVFLGHLSRERLAEVRSSAAACVMPSLQEGLPLALLEALYAGLPVIATDIAAAREVTELAATGRLVLVPPGDPDALRAALERVPCPAPPARPGGLPWPTWKTVALQVEGVYRRALADRAPGHVAPAGQPGAAVRPATDADASG
jgi:glycosyltransferase involved in cell wall biosynthesis